MVIFNLLHTTRFNQMRMQLIGTLFVDTVADAASAATV
jgi:hypothetical protein